IPNSSIEAGSGTGAGPGPGTPLVLFAGTSVWGMVWDAPVCDNMAVPKGFVETKEKSPSDSGPGPVGGPVHSTVIFGRSVSPKSGDTANGVKPVACSVIAENPDIASFPVTASLPGTKP